LYKKLNLIVFIYSNFKTLMDSVLKFVLPKDVIEYVIYKFLLQPIYSIKNKKYTKLAHNGKYIHVFKNNQVTIIKNKKKIIRPVKDIPQYSHGNQFFVKRDIHIRYYSYYPGLDYNMLKFKSMDCKYIIDVLQIDDFLQKVYLFSIYKSKNDTIVLKYVLGTSFEQEFFICGSIILENNVYTDLSDDTDYLYVYNTQSICIIEKKMSRKDEFELLKDCQQIKTIKSPIYISKMYKHWILSVNDKTIEIYNLENLFCLDRTDLFLSAEKLSFPPLSDFKLIDVIFVPQKIEQLDVSNDALIIKCKNMSYVYLLTDLKNIIE